MRGGGSALVVVDCAERGQAHTIQRAVLGGGRDPTQRPSDVLTVGSSEVESAGTRVELMWTSSCCGGRA
jgi:hypothetical protein